MVPKCPVTVVVMTRNRMGGLRRCLRNLFALPERPEVIVVDNASDDKTADLVRIRFPAAQLIRMPHNAGALARNVGAAAAQTPYVAFTDDDSGWEPGALGLACDILARHPRQALLAARIVVGPTKCEDPICADMAAAPWGWRPDMPGPTVLGFNACASVLRRGPFLDAGGFDPVLFFMGEEQVVAYDLTARGWGLAYCQDVVAWHDPEPPASSAKTALQARNRVLTAWLRRPVGVGLRETGNLAWEARTSAVGRRAFGSMLVRLPWALSRRRVSHPTVEAMLRTVPARASWARAS
jgi:GT2 family glycosyltransferase